ncbi:hypothetical protein Tco_0458347 [Tanacetum coccineum]
MVELVPVSHQKQEQCVHYQLLRSKSKTPSPSCQDPHGLQINSYAHSSSSIPFIVHLSKSHRSSIKSLQTLALPSKSDQLLTVEASIFDLSKLS